MAQDPPDATKLAGPPTAPMRVGDAPFRNMLSLVENEPGYLGEAKREIRAAALRELQALDEVHQQLLAQAKQVLNKARRDLMLHDIRVNATKIRGKTYYLYQRGQQSEESSSESQRFFSILAPAEYKSADPTAIYLATYRLNEDSSWTHCGGQELSDFQ